MKSIKSIHEKQSEYVETQAPSAESYEAYAEKEDIADAYEAGAEYVLDVIKEFVSKLNLDSNSNDAIHVFMEQLKGNQYRV